MLHISEFQGDVLIEFSLELESIFLIASKEHN